MNIVLINEDIDRFKDKYDFVDKAFKFNQQTNPNAAFYYITNNPRPIEGVEVHSVSDYEDKDCRLLEQHFTNLNSVPPELEFAWIKRWIILRNFLTKTVKPPILYSDNDVLLFTSISEWPQQVTGAEYSLSENASPHTNCMNNAAGIEAFANYILSIYIDRGAEFNKFKSIYERMQANKSPGGVGDMMLWTHFSRRGLFPNAIKDISQIFNESESFDHNIHTTNNFWREDGKYKKIIFKEGVPYCQTVDSDKLIKFHTLHFQGGAKSKMRKILQQKL